MDLNLSKPLAIVGVVIAAVLGLSILAALLPSLFDSTASVTENVTNGDVGNDQANSILAVFGFIVPLVIVVGIIGLIFLVARFSKK